MRSARRIVGRPVVAGAFAVAVSVALAGCSGPGGSPAPAASGSLQPVELTVYAAASLKGALEQAGPRYAQAHAATTVTISTDSSAALRTQIEQGAPADLFLSADTTNAQKLVDAGLAIGPPTAFAGNLLTIIVPKGNPAGLSSPADLARERVRIIAAGDEVPITKYVGQLVTKLAGIPGYPAGFAAAYAANVVTKVDNVKAVVTTFAA